MQTTSFQGVSPQLAATARPHSPSNVRALHKPASIIAGDSVHFSGTPTPEGSDRNTWQKTKDGIKGGFKAAFKLKEMATDLAWGTAGAIATAIIPPHLHALAVIPFIMITFGLIRFFRGVVKGFKGEEVS